MSEEEIEENLEIINKWLKKNFPITEEELRDSEFTVKDLEIERLNNIIKDIKSQLDYLETYSSKEDVFEDMKRRLDRIESIVNRK